MVYLRSVRVCTRSYCSPAENSKQGLKVTPISANIYIYSYTKLKGGHLFRMYGSRISKIASEYNPKVEDMWDVQERDGYCEVGTGQKKVIVMWWWWLWRWKLVALWCI